MRQVKYRLWCNNKKEWEKDEWYLTPSGRIIDARRQVEMKKETHFLNQFTGLFDKQGKEIYEDDIVLWENSDGEKVKDKVVFFRGAFRMRNMSFTLHDYMDSNIFEVIGNIYENPELLEGRI